MNSDIVKKEFLLGIDAGNTNLKAVIYDVNGNEVGTGSTQKDYLYPHPHWVERDMEDTWRGIIQSIKAAIQSSGVSPKAIKVVAVTGHGDGVYLVDRKGIPIRPGIPSIDTRATDILSEWKYTGIIDQALQLIGQAPFHSTENTLLAWIKKHEPEVYQEIGWVLSCKDWIRFKLTGEFFTDFTESSTAFANVRTQKYDRKAFKLFGLEELFDKMPPVKSPLEYAGAITKQVSEQTGLTEGTPVSTGLHDIDACSVGTGCIHAGQLEMIAGTWSINQVILDKFIIDKNSYCRNFIEPGQWTSLTGSPASATNLEWFVEELCQDEIEKAKQEKKSRFNFVDGEIASLGNELSNIYYLPYLYGSPFGEKASAGFIGINGWHTRADLLKAVYEGVVFNHKVHVDWLRACTTISEVRLSGGGTKSKIWSQMFADALDMPVIVTNSNEAGALGAVMCAAVGAGYYKTIAEAVERIVKIKKVYEPNKESKDRLAIKFEFYMKLNNALMPIWDAIG